MKKTLIIFALVLAMMLQLAPLSAFAAEETEIQVTEPAALPEEEQTEPEATEPEATEPEATEPEATEPEATEPEATEPEATEPEATEPETEAAESEGEGQPVRQYGPATNPAYRGSNAATLAKRLGDSVNGEKQEAEKTAAPAFYYVSDAVNYIRNCMEQRDTYFTFDLYFNSHSDADTLGALLGDMWYDAMEHTGVPTQGDYLYWHWAMFDAWEDSLFWNNSNGTCRLNAVYYADYYTTDSQERALTTRVNQIIDSFGFNAATTDYEKAYTIYKWVTDNITYDQAGLDRGEIMAHTAYKGVMEGTCVCQGYASIIYRMYLQVGIPCRVVAGDAESYSTPDYEGDDHGWNIAKIGGKWYNLDSTWDEGSVPADWEYFLRCPRNFTYHTRWSEYNTSSFHNAYPMATADFNPSVYNGLMDVVAGYKGYYINGFLQKNSTGFLQVGNKFYYVQNGIVDLNLTSLKESGGKWYFVEKGVWNNNFTDLCYYNDTWFYVVNGVIDWSYTGLVPYNGNYFYVQNNVLDWSYTSLGYHAGNWYFIQNGLLQLNYTGLVYFNDNWFYVQNGLLTYEYFGMVEYQGNYFYVQASHLDWSYTGLGYHDGGWYFIQNALMQRNYTGFVEFNGEWFYVEQGVLTFNYTGLVLYNGNYFYVEASRIRWDYTGYVWYLGQYHYVENGVMRWY